MRIVVATCSVEYSGRVSASLPTARRLLLVKADGTVVIHADAGSKPLNWMPAPCRIVERPDGWMVVGGRNGETLDIEFVEIHSDLEVELDLESGLVKTGSEAELQALLAERPDVIEDGLVLVEREFRTDLGPVDLLCRDAEGRAVAVEIKRVGELDGVEQLTRYVERLDRDARLRPVRGIFAAQVVRPQAKVLAESRGLGCVEVDFDVLAGRSEPDLTLF